MKRLFAFLVAALLLFGCAKGWNSQQLQPGASLTPSGVVRASLVSVNSSPAEQSVSIRFCNTGTQELFYGMEHRVEVWLEDAWYEVPPTDCSYPAIAAVLQPGEELTYTARLYEKYDSLPAGQYRYIKDFGDELVGVEFDILQA